MTRRIVKKQTGSLKISAFIDSVNNLSEKYMLLIVFCIFLINCLFTFSITNYPKRVVVYGDELLYLDLAKSIALRSELMVRNSPFAFSQILYPLLLSPVFLIKEAMLRMTTISAWNCILMSSTVFPSYLLSNKILKHNFEKIFVQIVIITIPEFALTATFMSEISFMPVSIWVFFFVFSFFEANKFKGKMFFLIMSSLFCALAYFNKAVALYMVVAFVVVIMVDMFLIKINSKKENSIFLFVFLSLFAILLFGIEKIIIPIENNAYSEVLSADRLKLFTDINVFSFFIYTIFINCIMALLGFLYFPVIIPLFKFSFFNKREKIFIIFLLICFITAIGTISGTISVIENLNELMPRQHLRYFMPLVIPFLLLFFKLMLNEAEFKYKKPTISFSIITGITVLLCVCYFTIVNYLSNSIVDGTGLMFYEKILPNLWDVSSLSITEFMFYPRVVIFKILLVLIISAGTALLFLNKVKKLCLIILTSLILCINSLNYRAAYETYSELYRTTVDDILDIGEMDKAIENLDGNILIITSTRLNVLDMNLRGKSYIIKSDTLLNLYEDEPYLDLTKTNLEVPNWRTQHYELESIDYIFMENDIPDISLDDSSVVELSLPSLKYFKLYKNLDKSRLCIIDNSFFPRTLGTTRTIYDYEGVFATQFDIKDNRYISIDGQSRALIYGPYANITKGEYEIKLYYEYTGLLEHGTYIGNADVFSDSLNLWSAFSEELTVGSNMVEIKGIVAGEDATDAEIRLFTDKDGVVFKRAEITKVN